MVLGTNTTSHQLYEASRQRTLPRLGERHSPRLRHRDFREQVVTVAASEHSGQHELTVTYLIGGRSLARTSLDINTSRGISLEPDTFTPASFVTMPDLAPPPAMRIYPVALHLADKVTAIYEVHGSDRATPSTRPHDLADIVVLSRSSPVDAGELIAAIRAEEQRRGVSVPTPLVLPDPAWIDTYPPRVAKSNLPQALHHARTALRAANAFIGPVLSADVQVQRRCRRRAVHWVPENYEKIAVTASSNRLHLRCDEDTAQNNRRSLRTLAMYSRRAVVVSVYSM